MSASKGMIQDRGRRLRGRHLDSLIPEILEECVSARATSERESPVPLVCITKVQGRVIRRNAEWQHRQHQQSARDDLPWDMRPIPCSAEPCNRKASAYANTRHLHGKRNRSY